MAPLTAAALALGTVLLIGCTHPRDVCGETRAQVDAIRQAVQIYKAKYGRLPRSIPALVAARKLDADEDWVDAWGNKIVYEVHGRSFDVFSAGADGVPRTSDDIDARSCPVEAKVPVAVDWGLLFDPTRWVHDMKLTPKWRR